MRKSLVDLDKENYIFLGQLKVLINRFHICTLLRKGGAIEAKLLLRQFHYKYNYPE